MWDEARHEGEEERKEGETGKDKQKGKKRKIDLVSQIVGKMYGTGREETEIKLAMTVAKKQEMKSKKDETHSESCLL